jgi:hypothetical protein
MEDRRRSSEEGENQELTGLGRRVVGILSTVHELRQRSSKVRKGEEKGAVKELVLAKVEKSRKLRVALRKKISPSLVKRKDV